MTINPGLRAQAGYGKPECCHAIFANKKDCVEDHDVSCFLENTHMVGSSKTAFNFSIMAISDYFDTSIALLFGRSA